MSSVIIALVVGVFAGALVLWLATRGQGNPAVLQSQGEIKARLDDTLTQVQRLGAIFANAAQRGRPANSSWRTSWKRREWTGTGTSSFRSRPREPGPTWC